jgi:hypothetical protein
MLLDVIWLQILKVHQSSGPRSEPLHGPHLFCVSLVQVRDQDVPYVKNILLAATAKADIRLFIRYRGTPASCKSLQQVFIVLPYLCPRSTPDGGTPELAWPGHLRKQATGLSRWASTSHC